MLTELQPNKKESRVLIKPEGGGFFEKALTVGIGVVTAYNLLAIAPVSAAAVLIGTSYLFIKNSTKFQHRAVSNELREIYNAKTPIHPSLNEIKNKVKRMYPVAALNAAIESMIGETDWVHFPPNAKHPLAKFGSVYCWINPEDESDVKLPLERIQELMDQWGVSPIVDTTAQTVNEATLDVQALPAETAIVDNSIPQNSQELLKRLEAECPELLKLVKAAPIRLVGKQRTGKSTFAKKLVLLRAVLLPGHTLTWSTPHRELDNPVPSELNPLGTTANGAKDFASIERVWGLTQTAIDNGQQLNLSAVWDEFGSYDQFEDEQLLSKSLKALLREATKHGYHPILVAHGDQSSFYPGVSGILTTLKDSTVKVETVGEIADSFGTMRPSGAVEVTQLDGSMSNFKVPEWLSVDLLISMLPGDTKPAFLTSNDQSTQETPSPVVEDSSPQSEDDFEVEEVKEVAQNEETPERRISKKLAEKILAAKGEWVNVRDLVKNNFKGNDDRLLAKQLIERAVELGKVDHEMRENANKTQSVFIRVKQVSTNS